MLADHPVSEEKVAEMFAADSDTGTWAKAFPLAYSNIEDHQKDDPEIQKRHSRISLYGSVIYQVSTLAPISYGAEVRISARFVCTNE
jgi:hypothetical protein